MNKIIDNDRELLIQKVKIPFKIAKRGKHKPHIIKPNNSVDEKIMDNALVQALGKAKLWEMELMGGLTENRAVTIDLEEFCSKERLTQKYVLKDLLQKPFPLLWEEQEMRFGLA